MNLHGFIGKKKCGSVEKNASLSLNRRKNLINPPHQVQRRVAVNFALQAKNACTYLAVKN